VSLMERVMGRAAEAGIPFAVHFDLTYRCNERCVHCYLDHDDHGEMTTAEVLGVLDQLAAAGTFFLTLSGGEVFLRPDFFDIVAHARALGFDVKVKTNGILLREREARRLRELGVRQVQISVYSHVAAVHDAITKVPGSLERSLTAIRLLRAQGVRVLIANVLMKQNADDYAGVQVLARDLGAEFTLDPTITPRMDGDVSILTLRAPQTHLLRLYTDKSLVGDSFSAPPRAVDEDVLDEAPCSAGHTACYVSPYADVYPCVQFPLPSGNLRRQTFAEIWQHSPQLTEVRGIRMRDLPTCSTCSLMPGCTRCPGLAYMEGNMRGPSSADCEKALVRSQLQQGTA
jgi:radical SAM protein with 4Fe4S-binding SPASM domain